MPTETLRGVIQAGHKEDAIEVPFSPAARWQAKQVRIRPGRRGYRVAATLARHAFESHVVARAGRHWLVLPAMVETLAGVGAGSEVEVLVQSVDGDG